ncbi:putative maltose permease [Mollisia scopiformis]|uniref:Putative maltose permease n=1 Tax=Mollisia scopiformis TaxID=149040 RepID=A0A194X5J9_MOLSC|nr:putative maltose permease [Mollisia scopiformis]KUJ15446.1 putative maltose permease [Mollisia scopiformis]
MSIWQAFRTYPKAVMFSIILSTAIVMEGYDVVLLANLYAFPSFNKKYGVATGNPLNPYQVPAPWQAGLSNGANVGEILGLFVNGIVSERYGYRKTMIVSLVAVIAFIFIPFFAQNLIDLQVGEILCGIPWGVFQTLTTAYASEVCPTQLRAYLTTYVNLCWVMGQLIGSGVLRSLVQRSDQWSYRIPFAIQWLWPIPIIIGVLFAPESPWWLVRRGRVEDAKKALRRLTSSKNADESFNVDDTIAMMVTTNELEKSLASGVGYLDCFKGIDLRRTEIVCVTWSIQNLCGSAFMGYSTYFYEQAGLPIVDSFDMSMAQYAIGFIGTIGSWFLMSHAGRRTLYVNGLALLTMLLLLIGLVSISKSKNSAWGIGSLLLIYTFTIGPVCYSLVSELPSTRLKTKTIVLARNIYNVVGIINGIIVPYMLNPTAWNWKGKAGFFWAGMCGLCWVWTYFRLPEPKGRTYGEMDVLFEKGVSARKFSGTDVSPWSHGNGQGGERGSEAKGKEKEEEEVEMENGKAEMVEKL